MPARFRGEIMRTLAEGARPAASRRMRFVGTIALMGLLAAGVALAEETRKNRRKKKRGNSPQFDLRQLLYLMSGVDLARIDGIDVITAMTVVAEAGYDMSPWPTADHFVSWLRLAPDNRISGDKVIGKGRTPTKSSDPGSKNGRQFLEGKQDILGSAIPPTPGEARSGRRRQGNGRQTCTFAVQHVAARHGVRRSWD